ncbi:MAG: hypothetical protein Kow0027_12730 [Saprospiraceae bacterium]
MKLQLNSIAQFTIFFLTILLVSCGNPMKMLEKGQYDPAIYASVKKLAGKKKKKAKYVKALEQAFERATMKDMREIEMLKREGREENWVEINNIVKRIKKRQRAIEPLLPLIDQHGYKASFKFVKVEELEIEAKAKAADYYYNEGRRLLALAERGDKNAAREAYKMFQKLDYYYDRYKDEDKLMQRALDLGTTYVLFDVQNHSNVLMPREFDRELRRINLSDLQRKWRQVHSKPVKGIEYDYTATLYITQIVVSPETFKEREYIDDKTIEEGWEYVLDENGNVRKDSAGNDIKIPKKVLIKARVFETYQHKAAVVSGILELTDKRLDELIRSEPVTVEVNFENYAATFKGDERALTEESKKKLGNKPMPFPSDEMLILDAAEKLKPIIKEKLRRARLD